MKDPWDKAYVYGRTAGFESTGQVAHIVEDRVALDETLCGDLIDRHNRTAKPYPVCKNCLRTKRAKELGL